MKKINTGTDYKPSIGSSPGFLSVAVAAAGGGERGVTGDQGSGKVNRESRREIATNGVPITYQ